MFLRAHCNFIAFITIAVADLPGPCQVSSVGEGSRSDGVRTCRAQNLLQLDAQGQPIKRATSAALASAPAGSLPLASFVQLGSEESKPSTNPHVSLSEMKVHLPSGVSPELAVAGFIVGILSCLLLVFAISARTTHDEDGNIRRSFAQDHANALMKGQHGSDRAARSSQVLSDMLARGATPEEAAAAAKEQMRKDERIAGRKKGCCYSESLS
eukprot:TRINITY_DN90914_c0_g1_i1.p1 TRINITY_DN90914_c0_g1~~TRINITY_DN90914_c0_g1_i1.p1  ORF type:complete len:212 (+),score=23.31 TRINITY_DN90914_c0_g1_i1:89-724(+)